MRNVASRLDETHGSEMHENIAWLLWFTHVDTKWPWRLHQMHGCACSARRSTVKNAIRCDMFVLRKRVLLLLMFDVFWKTIVFLCKSHNFGFAARCSLLAACRSLLAARRSLLAARSLFFVVFLARCSLLAARCSLHAAKKKTCLRKQTKHRFSSAAWRHRGYKWNVF